MNQLIIVTDIVEKMVLLSLLGLSIWSISVIIDRRRFFKNYLSDLNLTEFKNKIISNQISEIKSAKILKDNNFFSSAIHFLTENNTDFKSVNEVDRMISSFIKEDRIKLEKGLTVLSTLGANAPFIGLFGTVLGIIRAFAYLGSQSGSSSVMSGVSQALYATAVGLLVAIPAVVAFNYFSSQIKKSILQLESLRDLIIAKNKSV